MHECWQRGGLHVLESHAGRGAIVSVRARVLVLGVLTNVVSVSSSLPDFNALNNSVTNVLLVVPNASLALAISEQPVPVWLGENLSYSIAITNPGPNAAAAAVLTNLLHPGTAFVSASSSQGSCSRAGDVVRCELGTLVVNGSASVSIVVRPAQAGFITNRASVFSPTDADGSDNVAVRVSRVLTGNVPAVNAAAIATPILGLANPYPSTITVAGVSSAIFRVRVSLLNLSHSFADDLDVLLVGPDGRATLLMSDAGGESALNGVSLTFDDGAAGGLADGFLSLAAGSPATVRPANFGVEQDFFAAPAPAGGYATNLSIFNGSDPNGSWSLYVMDDAEKDSGTVAGGWRLTISAFEPMADLALALAMSNDQGSMTNAQRVAVGSNVVFTSTVTNLGPAVAGGVRVTNWLPVGMVFTGFTNAHGACMADGVVGMGSGVSRLVCELGSISPGGTAGVAVAARAAVAGSFTNVAVAGFDGVDLRLANNTAAAAVVFELPPVFTVQPATQSVPPGGSVVFTAAATGAAPLVYQWHFTPTSQLPTSPPPTLLIGATGASLVLNNISFAQAGAYRVRASNRVGAAWSEAALLLMPGPPTISALPDVALEEDGVSGAVAFTVQDFDTAAASLSLGAESSNPALVPVAGIVFGGSGQNRTLTVSPARNESGPAVIAVRVADVTGAAATNFFSVVVRPVLDPITILVQPRHRLAVTGGTVVVSVSAASDLPLSFQWERNGVAVEGAAGASLTLADLSAANAGDYRVRLSNADTNIWSATAGVVVTDVLPVPDILSISQNGSTATVTFTTVVGLGYSLEFKRFLEDASWSVLGSVQGTGDSEILTDSAAGGAGRFYRVRAE